MYILDWTIHNIFCWLQLTKNKMAPYNRLLNKHDNRVVTRKITHTMTRAFKSSRNEWNRWHGDAHVDLCNVWVYKYTLSDYISSLWFWRWLVHRLWDVIHIKQAFSGLHPSRWSTYELCQFDKHCYFNRYLHLGSNLSIQSDSVGREVRFDRGCLSGLRVDYKIYPGKRYWAHP